MGNKTKIEVKKDKKRIPLPQKPPKVEETKKKYNRQKSKKEVKTLLEEKHNPKKD
ncbi:MAG: hypothetical protein Q8933_08220 [Bacteroidota bacterium]|nr:hypothetical protein [Bacteroidota bacterium]MDP4190980.1 hypothetical protein [Bacteroidota bacterium]MDP4195119.1 hypothetical protein [Bacteroidota bacterium]